MAGLRSYNRRPCPWRMTVVLLLAVAGAVHSPPHAAATVGVESPSTPATGEIGQPATIEPGAESPPRAQLSAPTDPPVLAHYYIWFEATSWNRAKTDYPALGRYTSDDATVMRDHVTAAKAVGIDGFIVSWKSTEVLDPRLEQLIAIAEEEDFKLAITYQGLDFNRDPLPVRRIGDDLDVFVERYADSEAFDLFDKPLVVLTGTWEFTADDVGRITSPRRNSLHALATARNVDDYRRVAQYVDGNLYYWSSVNPGTHPGYPQKLVDMGGAVRAHGGIWLAPAAPGFDARKVGGTSVVERAEGQTLRRQWEGALASLPHAIGIISWNEFSENTHIEPSDRYGTRSLEVVADLTGAPEPTAVQFDSDGSLSDEPAAAGLFDTGPARIATTLGLAIAIAIGALVGGRRRRERSEQFTGETA